ncbi:hypothetical protein GUITHDRAFT_159625 [Guillardia theta CCMP2712]|uniref:Uncharacterized protein n=2 Tax=Guillardia theta TaxID=55529 RepID=L1JE08_GUITC|nr:hypothetical protein GUITHDRAFT_159625 [Guillardia theta CCMP2712]EKX46552.1 hypothetical protein GUITHDRAFT_159625 [Guillardia theta CCMP2712]|eukprot:XP_005833532.1 hypothetical protein GUITHDRAFT_159625 [Guillardia theta CCMP2712]
MLKRCARDEMPVELSEPVAPKALEQSKTIVEDVKSRGEAAVRHWAEKFNEVKEGESLVADKDELKAAYDTLSIDQQGVLTRVADRIQKFAVAQRASIQDTEVVIPGGKAGQLVSAVENAGCYAPGGRYPLPSSVLMTAVTARAAGVKNVWVASPHPDQVTKAAAHVAGADGMLKVGGAQAIAALAQGIGKIPACNIIVGPGNQWVTAAKSLVQGQCAIDMLAGPSEVLVIADETADPKTVAADLLAQAEHDVESRPILITTHEPLLTAVNSELKVQLDDLPSPNCDTAKQAVAKGFCVVTKSMDEAIEISDQIAPEHLEIMTADAMQVGMKCNNYGGLFIGRYAAEVLGDYGCGPNHVLPTGGTAKYTGGLSVHTFLRIRTWMRVDSQEQNQPVVQDSIALARMEGLEGHARAAEVRKL